MKADEGEDQRVCAPLMYLQRQEVNDTLTPQDTGIVEMRRKIENDEILIENGDSEFILMRFIEKKHDQFRISTRHLRDSIHS
jgi:hypothetical protein